MSHALFQYSEITPHIILGTNLCCTAHGTKLAEMNIAVDISLEKERIDAPEEITAYQWIPVIDHEAPTLEQLYFGTATIAEAEARNVRVYVHCKNGHGRSPTLVIAHFIRKGKSLDDAMALVKTKRPEISPNDKQLASLYEFKKSLTS